MLSRLSAIAVLCGASIATAGTINVPTDQPTIKAAVGAAVAGDTIVVAPGVYSEAVTVKKGLDGLTLMGVADSSTGAFPAIVCPGTGSDGVRVKARGVTVSGFGISHCNNGLRFDYAPAGVGSHLAVSGVRTGVNVRNSPGARVADSTIDATSGAQGILVAYAANLVLDGNAVSNPYREGIRVGNAPGAQITGNTVSGATRTDGVRLDRIPGGTVSANTVTGSKNDGLRISNSPHVSLTSNVSSANRHFGIRVDKCPPIASVADVLAAGNTASGDGASDVRVYK